MISFMAFPVGLLTAIYLSEYAPDSVRSTVKPILEVAGRRAHGGLRFLCYLIHKPPALSGPSLRPKPYSPLWALQWLWE